ncbi:MAG: glycosyltransferase family 4 protein [Chlorobi bacterium]|nr:glycosyltransferase family 4 protein [Chlorobiota bacterium]
MKKICFVIPRAYYLFNPDIQDAKDKVGGAQKQSFLLSTSLADDNSFDVHFIVADFGQLEFEEIKNVKLHKSFNFSANIFKRIIKLLKTLKKINADIYIFRSADIGVAFAVLYIKMFLHKKILYMLAADAEATKKRQKHHNGYLTSLAMQIVYKKADIITAQTQQQSDIFERNRNRKPNAKIKNIYNVENNKQIISDEKNTILWVGRLAKIKNPKLFIKLAERYPNERFVMIAPVVRDHIEYGNTIQEKAKKINNLKLINFVNPENINEYYGKAKIYVLTSYLEGFSNTMAEAMIAECPILSYNVNPDNILNDYKCGFCTDKNIDKFYVDFEKLNSDFELRKQFGKNGLKYIRDNHQKEQIIKKFISLLNTI